MYTVLDELDATEDSVAFQRGEILYAAGKLGDFTRTRITIVGDYDDIYGEIAHRNFERIINPWNIRMTRK